MGNSPHLLLLFPPERPKKQLYLKILWTDRDLKGSIPGFRLTVVALQKAMFLGERMKGRELSFPKKSHAKRYQGSTLKIFKTACPKCAR